MEQTHKCKNCQKEFTTSKHFKKFCSKQCREKHWFENNRENNNRRVRKYRALRYEKEGQWRNEGQKAQELKSWMIELKSKPCQDCGKSFEICCMDFDHRIDSEKKYNLGSMFAHHYSRELIEEELEKCDLVCSNCHRIRTKNKRTGSGKYKISTDAKDGQAK